MLLPCALLPCYRALTVTRIGVRYASSAGGWVGYDDPRGQDKTQGLSAQVFAPNPALLAWALRRHSRSPAIAPFSWDCLIALLTWLCSIDVADGTDRSRVPLTTTHDTTMLPPPPHPIPSLTHP